ncbi:MAG TPA: extracellular solute-binding protein [Candidatus Limnocylindrales bacterium]|nr:extracellular solute-binding protein [Candidatus Limnocylindrales bacterium]
MDVRHRSPRVLALLGAVTLVVAACSAGPSANANPWSGAPDAAKAKTEGATLVTYGMPDDWANYGAIIQAFCAKYQIAGCVHQDTDMTSAEEIQRYDAEKNNAVAIFSDIGLAYGPLASAKGVVPDYLPPNADQLPANLKAQPGKGGWVATFVGVPSILVNLDALKAKNLQPPADWADLAKPEYKGLVGVRTPGKAGEGDAFFMALVTSTGGSWGNFDSGIALAKQIAPNLNGQAGNADLAEKGEIPILVKYDFNNIAIAKTLQAKGINTEVIIPSSGSIYAPSGMMVNGYNTRQTDIAKLYMDFVLSTDAQTLFAKFGARPILSVLGKLQLPADATADWLPDSQYTNVKQIDFTQVDPTKIDSIWTDQVTAG